MLADLGPLGRAAFCALIALGVLRATSRRAERALLLLCAAAILIAVAAPLSRAVRGQSRDYSWAHYRLGAGFFDQVGYTDLYPALLRADRAGHWAPDGPAPIQERRDLRTYAQVPATSRPSADRAELADAVAFFQPRLTPGEWRSFFRDKGYNGTPAWRATSGRIVTGIPLTGPALAAVGVADFALLCGAVVLLGWVFGPGAGLLAGAWLALFYGAAGHLLGGPMQLDWAVLAILAVCALGRGRPGLGGALVGASVALRIFPAMLLLAPLVAASSRWHAVSRVPRSWLRFFAGAALGVALLGGLGALADGGPGSWLALGDKLATHSAEHHFGDRRIGLAPLLAWVPQGALTDAEARARRAEAWPGRTTAHRLLTALLSACWLVGVLVASKRRPRGVRTPRQEDLALIPLMLLGLGLLFVVSPISRYYMLLPALFFCLPRGGAGARAIGAGLFAGLAIVSWSEAVGMPDATVYAIANLSWLVLGAAVMGGAARRGLGACSM